MKTIKSFKLITYTILICCISVAAKAAKPSSEEVSKLLKVLSEQATRLSDQETQLKIQQEELKRQQQEFLKEKKKFLEIKAQVKEITGTTAVLDENNTSISSTSASADAGEPTVVGTARKEEADAQEEKAPEIAAYIDEGGVLLGKGKLVVTPSVEYTRSSATTVAIDGFSIIPAVNIGLFEIARVARDTLTGSVGVRYGLSNRFEIDAEVPYIYRTDGTTSRPVGTGASAETFNEVSSHNIGDVEVGAHYQINDGRDGWPYLIGNMRFKSRTGTSPFEASVDRNGLPTELATGSGFYALQPSITAIFPSEPVVYYGNIGYLYNHARDFGGTVGEIDPGDNISGSFGMSLSLNDRASFSVGYSHNTVLKTQQNGVTVPNAANLQVGSLDLGYSYNLNEMTNLNFTVSAGLTEDAPDARLIMRVPMTFDLN